MVRNILNYILSVSLIWTPYALAQPPAKEFENFIDQFSTIDAHESENLKVQEAVNTVKDIHTSILSGKLNEYIQENPHIKDQFDSLLIGKQVAQFYDVNSNVYKEIDYDTREHISKFSDRILSIDVTFDNQGTLVFEGVVILEDEKEGIQRHVSVSQKINHIKKENVLDYAYDQELLSILYKTEHGVQLILYHMPYAKEIIGGSPIPAAVVYLDILEELQSKTDQFKILFISQDSKPLTDTNGYYIQNSKEEFLFQAGDLLIVYDEKNQTKFADLKTRKGLYEMVREMYEGLDLLLEVRQSSNYLERILEISKEKKDLKAHNPAQLVYDLVNGLLNRNALDFLNQYRSQYSYLATYYMPFLKDATNTNQILTFSEWEKENPTSMEDRKRKHEKIISFLSKIGIPNKFIDKTLGNNFINKALDHKLEVSVALIGFVLAWYQFSTFTYLESSPTTHALLNMTLLGAGVLGMVYGLTPFFIPFLRFINKSIPQTNSKILNSFQKSIQKTIQKWEGSDTKTLLSGLGFKVVGALAPIFKRMYQLAGFSAVHYGLSRNLGTKALRTVKADSSLGSVLKLNKDLKMWVPYLNHREKIEALDATLQSNSRIDHLTRIMTYHSLLGSPSFDLSMPWIGTLSLDLPQLIKQRGGENQFLLDFHWIQKKLKKYIEKSSNSFEDISQRDKELLDHFYSEAKKLNAQSKNISNVKKGLSQLSANSSQFLSKILNWNSAQADRLNNIKPNPTIATQFSVNLVIDHITMITLPLTFFTPRGTDNYSLGVDDYRFFNSSSPHLVEVALNVLAHIRGTAGAQLTDLSGQEMERLTTLVKSSETNYKEASKQRSTKIPTSNYWLSSFKFPFQFGNKINPGTPIEERVDAGHFSWNWSKNWYRFMFIGLSISFLTRELFTAYGIDMSVLGSLYFAAGAIIYFAWPQLWTITHNQSLAKRLDVNRKNIDLILSVHNKMEKNLYKMPAGHEQQESDVRSVLKAFRSLYQHLQQYYSTTIYNSSFSSELFGTRYKGDILENLKNDVLFNEAQQEAILAYLESKSESEADVTLNRLMQTVGSISKSKLVKSIHDTVADTNEERPNPNARYFPNENNERALTWHSLLTLGIISNLAFVYLSVDSFDASKATVGGILALGGLTFGAFFGYNLLSSQSFAERKGHVKRALSRWTGKKIEKSLFKNPQAPEKKIINTLKSADVITIKELSSLSQEEIENIPGIGKKTAEKIQEALSHTTSIGIMPKIKNRCAAVFGKLNKK